MPLEEKPKIDFRDPQYVIAIGVTIISLCALIVSVMQTQILREESELMREYSRASVWPRLELGLSKGHNQEDGSIMNLNMSISNSGIGPAIITDATVKYADSIARNWWHLFYLQQIPDSIETWITNRSFNGQIIQAGERVEILNLDANLPLANAFFQRLDSITFEIYYESIYKEKWKYDGETTVKLDDFEGLSEEAQFGN